MGGRPLGDFRLFRRRGQILGYGDEGAQAAVAAARKRIRHRATNQPSYTGASQALRSLSRELAPF